MEDYINSKFINFDNDASASSFGWNFQANAGIFLFLYYIKDAQSIKIESTLQDIEIKLQDDTIILSQAKSAQDYSTCTSKKSKFKDAIISLAKTKNKGDKFIYICNIPNTLESTNNAFDNKVVSYSECTKNIKDEIDDIFVTTLQGIESKMQKITEKDTKTKKDEDLIKKNRAIKKQVENFDKNKLYISVINPFWGEEQNRYQIIEDAVVKFLCNTVGFDRKTALSITYKLLSHWQNIFNHNSTVKDTDSLKNIKKKDFLWPVIVYSSNIHLSEVENTLSFQPDYSIQEEVQRLIDLPESIIHERFQFTNKVLNEFKKFKNTNSRLTVKELHINFLIEKYTLFTNEFDSLTSDRDEIEYITKYFMQKIISNNKNINKVFLGTGVNK